MSEVDLEQLISQTTPKRNKHVPSHHLETWENKLLAPKRLPAGLGLTHGGLWEVVADLAIENHVQNVIVDMDSQVVLVMPALVMPAL